MATEEAHYQPRDAISSTINSALVAGGAGALMSAVQNTLHKDNIGALGVFRRTGSTIGIFTAMGAAYEFSRCASSNLRRKNDMWDEVIGGAVGGAVLGLRHRTFAAVIGLATAAGVSLGTIHYTGGALQGYVRDKDHDEFARKQTLRTERRRPIQETIDELGEGRGIHGPGYAERRQQRIKENYGIDVPS